ncbi:HelD family protein [Brachybacterium hainanense]|uniref:HelD family protein n=1 Tax=Brachybacterium hainanense TaxID=1541174 RepID=A0ABV6RF83_9MICO
MSTAERDAAAAQQVGEEQRALDAMHARVEAERAERIAARATVLARTPEDASESVTREAEAHRFQERIRQLEAAVHALCFGRIDPSGGGRGLHIGRIGLRDAHGETLLVDWRAEAARPFYAATPAEPLGLRRRRHLRLQGRTIEDVSDEILDGSAPLPGDLVGDGPLAEALSGARTGRMREAASTLQAEQDRIVRSPHRGITVVDGGPGTGKTIVALHRAAYVLYAWPAIAGRGVLVHGPNRRFLRYISDVLPSLGENDVQLATLEDLVGEQATRSEPHRIARLKGRAEFADLLAAAVRAHQVRAEPITLRTAHGTATLPATVVEAARRTALQDDRGHEPARAVLLETLVDDLVHELEEAAAQEEAEFEHELATQLGLDLDRAVAGDLGRLGPTTAASPAEDIDWDLIQADLLEDPGLAQQVTALWPVLRAADLLRDVLADLPALRAAFPDAPAADLESIAASAHDRGWTIADLSLLDEARALVDGPPPHVFGHVVVDEAQQLSPMHWRAIMRRCPERSMTIVGDLAQAGPTTSVRSWVDALAPFVEDRFEHRTLTINYRTTAEILEATRPLLARIAPEQRLSTSIRHGQAPQQVAAGAAGLDAALRELVAQLTAEHPGELIGVITRADAVVDVEAAVIGAPDARGLEFDTVIIVDPAGIEAAGEAGPRDLYVAMTRATRRLISLVPGE